MVIPVLIFFWGRIFEHSDYMRRFARFHQLSPKPRKLQERRFNSVILRGKKDEAAPIPDFVPPCLDIYKIATIINKKTTKIMLKNNRSKDGKKKYT
jgi:hypothetical protein